MQRIRDFALAAAALTLATGVACASPDKDIRQALEKVVPGIKITSIQPAPIDGLYEVMAGTDVMYVTGDGRYFMSGHIVDLENRKDITEPRLAESRSRLMSEVGDNQTVVFSPKQPEHTVTVFTDIECGYCRKLHSQIGEYEKQGIGVRYMFFPRAGKGSPAYEEAVSVWCAGDDEARRAAMTKAKSGQQIAAKTCDNPIDAHMALGEDLGLRGTPAILTETGELIPGYVDPKQLAARLNGDVGS